MKSFHQRLAKSRGTLRGPVQGLLLCTAPPDIPPSHLTSSSHWPPALWKGLSVSLARWQTCRMQSNLWMLLRTWFLAIDSMCPRRTGVCPLMTVSTPATQRAAWLLGWLPPLALGCATTLQVLSCVNTLCDQDVSMWYLIGYRARRIRTSSYTSHINISTTDHYET